MNQYPWQVLEDVLRSLEIRRPDVMAGQIIAELRDRGWRLKADPGSEEIYEMMERRLRTEDGNSVAHSGDDRA